MSDTRYLDWPFFEPRHAQLQRELDGTVGLKIFVRLYLVKHISYAN
jgi:hypothetical protein